MTLTELGQRMTTEEYEVWMAEEMTRAEECPNCGVDVRDMMNFEVVKYHCPVCGEDSKRVKRIGPSIVD